MTVAAAAFLAVTRLVLVAPGDAPAAGSVSGRLFVVPGGSLAVGASWGPAAAAGPQAVSAAPDGDQYHDTVRRVTADGVESVAAGTGVAGFSGDGGPATAAQISLSSAGDNETHPNPFKRKPRRLGRATPVPLAALDPVP